VCHYAEFGPYTQILQFGPYRVLGKPETELVQKRQFIPTVMAVYVCVCVCVCGGHAGVGRLYHGVGYSIPRAILGSGSHFVFYETTRRLLLADRRRADT